MLAHEWASLLGEVEPAPASMNKARNVTSTECVIEALLSSIAARRNGTIRPADTYLRLASVQMETMQLRAAASIGGEAAPLDRLSAAIGRGIAENELPV